jgi:hypothetical protein
VSSAATGVPDLEAARKNLQERCPAADVWYMTDVGGHVTWTLAVHADTPEHLVEALRDAAQDAGVAS